MRKVRLVLAECYANACFSEAIVERLGLNVKPQHTYKMGRDRVLKRARKKLHLFRSLEEVEKAVEASPGYVSEWEVEVNRNIRDYELERRWEMLRQEQPS